MDSSKLWISPFNSRRNAMLVWRTRNVRSFALQKNVSGITENRSKISKIYNVFNSVFHLLGSEKWFGTKFRSDRRCIWRKRFRCSIIGPFTYTGLASQTVLLNVLKTSLLLCNFYCFGLDAVLFHDWRKFPKFKLYNIIEFRQLTDIRRCVGTWQEVG